MFQGPYIPKEYLREIVLSKGNSGQLYLYHAILADLKPMLDDWIPVNKIKIFERACKKYGLFIAKESIFVDWPRSELEKSIGKESLNTTKTFGSPLSSNYEGSMHVFVSKSKEILEQGKRYGWYPESINGRIINKPNADHYIYGEFLGYPKCCRIFFVKFNDHNKYPNTLYMPFTNTKSPHFLCNSLTKDSYSYLFHIPCSFDCKKTIELASKLRRFICEKDPVYANLIDEHMKMVFLVFRERDIYAFKGTLNNNEIIYTDCYFVDYYLYPGEHLELFKKGNRITMGEKEIKVFFNNKLIGRIHKKFPECGFPISFTDKHGQKN
jgi:hypothetical protein